MENRENEENLENRSREHGELREHGEQRECGYNVVNRERGNQGEQREMEDKRMWRIEQAVSMHVLWCTYMMGTLWLLFLNRPKKLL